MKRELKQALKDAYSIPKPPKKEEFLRTLNYPKTRWYDFLFSQISYIQKKVWVVSLLLFIIILLFMALLQKGDSFLLWAVSAMFPFLALVTVTETARSAVFGLAELEMTTRYSLRSVLFTRMGTIGTGNLMLLLILAPILAGKVGLGVFKIGVYLLVPYLLTSFILFTIVNHIRSKDHTYFCAAAAAIVSSGGLLFGKVWCVIYQQQYFLLWLAFFIILAVALSKEISILLKNTEELVWNSFLTA